MYALQNIDEAAMDPFGDEKLVHVQHCHILCLSLLDGIPLKCTNLSPSSRATFKKVQNKFFLLLFSNSSLSNHLIFCIFPISIGIVDRKALDKLSEW